MQRRILAIVASFIGLLGAQRHAFAQVAGFAVDRFEPSERGSDWFVNDSLDLRGAPNLAAGLVLDWAYKPLVLNKPGNTDGRALGNVLTDRVLAHAGASLMFDDRWRVSFDLPVALYQHGDDVSGVARAADGLSLGDLRLAGDWRFVGHYGDVFTAALGLQVHVPTGSRANFTSDGTVRATPRISIAGDGEGLVYAAKLGFAYRPLHETFEGRKLGSEAVFSVAAGVRVNDIFVFGPELYGSTVVTNGGAPLAQRSTPLELLLGGHLKLAKHWRVGSGIGPGFTRGDGTPTMRVLLSIEFAPDVCVDPDGDGICNPFDACPDVDGVRTGERSTNGCPGDRDQDGISDQSDACPEQAGARSDIAAKNGCPAGKGEAPPEGVTPH